MLLLFYQCSECRRLNWNWQREKICAGEKSPNKFFSSLSTSHFVERYLCYKVWSRPDWKMAMRHILELLWFFVTKVFNNFMTKQSKTKTVRLYYRKLESSCQCSTITTECLIDVESQQACSPEWLKCKHTMKPLQEAQPTINELSTNQLSTLVFSYHVSWPNQFFCS